MSKSKSKGTAFETLIVNYLKVQGYPRVERRALTGKLDKGDISFDPRFVLECKDHKTLALSGWVNEAEKEAENAGAPFGAVIAKRRGYGDPGRQYVVMELGTFLNLIACLDSAKVLQLGDESEAAKEE